MRKMNVMSRLSNGFVKYHLILMSAVTSLLILLQMKIASCSGLIPDIGLYKTNEDIILFFENLEHCGELRSYQAIRLLDMLYPVVYGHFFYLRLVRPLRKTFRIAKLSLILTILADYVENLLVIYLFYNSPSFSPITIFSFSLATYLKWAGMVVLILLTAFAYLKRSRENSTS